jgi:hypothetical protein
MCVKIFPLKACFSSRELINLKKPFMHSVHGRNNHFQPFDCRVYLQHTRTVCSDSYAVLSSKWSLEFMGPDKTQN